MALPVTISVVIPAWNAGTTLTRCLDSLKEQTREPFEVILVDDGSTDDTRRLAEGYQVKVLSTGGRKGPASARNLGAEEAGGDVLLFLDSDVTVPGDLLEKVAGHFRDDAVWAVQTLYTPLCPACAIGSRYQNYYYWYSLNRMPGENSATFATWCAAVRRNRFLEIGGFNVRIPEPTVEDEELGYTIADLGGSIVLDKSLKVTHLASYDISQFTSRRLRMARAQAKSGWRQVKDRLLARYINVKESGTHHSRWVVLSIILVLTAQLSAAAGLAAWDPAFLIAALAAVLLALVCHWGFLASAAGNAGKGVLLPFALMCLYGMAVLGWGIVQGTMQFAMGRKY